MTASGNSQQQEEVQTRTHDSTNNFVSLFHFSKQKMLHIIRSSKFNFFFFKFVFFFFFFLLANFHKMIFIYLFLFLFLPKKKASICCKKESLIHCYFIRLKIWTWKKLNQRWDSHSCRIAQSPACYRLHGPITVCKHQLHWLIVHGTYIRSSLPPILSCFGMVERYGDGVNTSRLLLIIDF